MHFRWCMFTVEVGFFLVLFIALFPGISSEFVGQTQLFYYETAAILIITVWFATFSESLSEAQARARVDSLRTLEKEVVAHKIVNGNGMIVDVASTGLNPGDEVRVSAGEIIPRDGLVNVGKAFVDESMMTGESNPVYKEKGDHVVYETDQGLCQENPIFLQTNNSVLYLPLLLRFVLKREDKHQ